MSSVCYSAITSCCQAAAASNWDSWWQTGSCHCPLTGSWSFTFLLDVASTVSLGFSSCLGPWLCLWSFQDFHVLKFLFKEKRGLSPSTGCWSSLYSLSMNYTENTTSKSFFIAATWLTTTIIIIFFFFYSMVWVRERTIPTKRPPLLGEMVANFCGQRVPRGQRDGSLQPYSRFSRLEPLLFLPSSSATVLMRLSGPRSRPTASHKIW
jgi:hypothetical protein